MTNPSPSAGSVPSDYTAEECAKRLLHLANHAVKGTEWIHNPLSKLYRRAAELLTAAPTPVLVIELDQPSIADGVQCNEQQPHAPRLAWRTIESAPKDGTHILVVHQEWWMPLNGDNRWIYSKIGESWFDARQQRFHMGVMKQPTHWMPMPLMPDAETRRTAPDDTRLLNCIPSDPSPAVLNEELVRALEDVRAEINLEKSPKLAARIDAALSRSKPSP